MLTKCLFRTITIYRITIVALVLAILVEADPPDPLRIVVLDWLTSWPDLATVYYPLQSQAIAAHFLLAAQHWNDRRGDILPVLGELQSCHINISVTGYCDEGGENMVAVPHLIEFADEVDFVLGFSSVAVLPTSVFAAASLQVPLVSYWTTLAPMEAKDQFPLYARTIIGDTEYLAAVASFVSGLNIDQVAVLHVDGDAGVYYLDALEKAFFAQGIAVTALHYQWNDTSTQEFAFNRIKQTDLNVIIVTFYESDLTNNFPSLAEQYGLNAPDKLWIFTNYDTLPTTAQVLGNKLTSKLLTHSVYLKTDMVNSTLFDRFTDQWPTYEPQRESFNAFLPPHSNTSTEDVSCKTSSLDLALPPGFFNDTSIGAKGFVGVIGALAYDSVMAAGLAACSVGATSPGSALYSSLMNLDFMGMTGRMRFDNSTGNRLSDSEGFVFTATLFDGNFSPVSIGRFDAELGAWNLSLPDAPFKMGLGVVPVAITPSPVDLQLLPTALRKVAVAEVFVVCFVCMCLAVWLFRQRFTRVVMQSQPVFMLPILLGCALSSWAIIGLAIDDSGNANASAACNEAPLVFAMGFLLALSSLWGKTRRLQSVFATTSLHVGLRVRRVLVEISAVLALGLVMCITVVFASPLEWRRRVVALDAHGFPLTSLGSCETSNNGTGVLLVLLFALNIGILAHTLAIANAMKNVPEEFSEAKYISMSTTIIGQIAVLAIPVVYAVYTNVIGRFVMLSCIVFFSNAALLGPLFVPKLRKARRQHIIANKHSVAPGPGAVNNIGVMDGLSIPRVRDRFTKFCGEAQTIEHVFFLCDVTEWKDSTQLRSSTWIAQKGEALAKIYIYEGSLMQVNISAEARSKIEDSVVRHHIDEHLFDQALSEVVQLTTFGPWIEFIEGGGLFGQEHLLDKHTSHESNNQNAAIGSDGEGNASNSLISQAVQVVSRVTRFKRTTTSVDSLTGGPVPGGLNSSKHASFLDIAGESA